MSEPRVNHGSGTAAGPGPFLWPPRTPQLVAPVAPVRVGPCDPGASRPATPSARPGRQARAGRLWGAVERTWLDVTAAPLAERLARAAWSPDIPGADYCARCAHSVGVAEAGADGCASCRARRLPWSVGVRLGPYMPPLDDLVREVKFTRWRRLGLDLGRLLGAAVAAELVRREVAEEPVIVPVPSTFARRLVRGIDHARTLADGVAEATGGRVCEALWRRHRRTQLGLTPGQRARNVAGTNHLRRGVAPMLAGRLIVLVDDVITTGATMRTAGHAVARGLRAAGSPPPSRIWAAVVAVTPEAGRRSGRVAGGDAV